MLSYTIEALKQYPGEVALIEELGCFLDELESDHAAGARQYHAGRGTVVLLEPDQ